MKKRKMYAELAYVLGLLLLALGTALMETADFGMSMLVAPAYLLHLKLSQVWPFFSFGMAEYLFQFVLMIVLVLVLRRFRWSYLVSILTAVLYGAMLDGSMALAAQIPDGGMALRFACYIVGMVTCSAGVALLFNSYISPEVYELFVKELSLKHGVKIARVKTVYDLASCALAVVLSFAFFGFGRFEGVKWGTVVCAAFNGWIIGRFAEAYERYFEVCDALPLRRYLA